MGKFKFKSSEFVGDTTNPIQIAARANELLEAELGRCVKVHETSGTLLRDHCWLTECCVDKGGGDTVTATALLFNVTPIGEGESAARGSEED